MTPTRLLIFLCAATLFGACGDSGDAAGTSDAPTQQEGDASVSSAAEADIEEGSVEENAGEVAEEEREAEEPPPSEEPPSVDCNPIANTGCAEGEKCIYDDTDNKACAPAGETPGGSPCQDTSECMEGMCLALNGTDSYCYILCKTIGHCPNNAPCLELQDSPYKVCKIDDLYDTCNILTQDCEGGKGCYSVAGEDQPVCLPAGIEPVGGVCEGPSDCSPGHHCVNFRCYELCDKNDPNSCGLFGKCSSTVAAGVGYCDEQQN